MTGSLPSWCRSISQQYLLPVAVRRRCCRRCAVWQAATDAIAAFKAATAKAKVATARAEAATRHVAEYENVEQSQLHGQAIALPNIKTVIPSSYPQADIHRLHPLAHALSQDHDQIRPRLPGTVLYDDFSTDPHWHHMDCTGMSWLFGTV